MRVPCNLGQAVVGDGSYAGTNPFPNGSYPTSAPQAALLVPRTGITARSAPAVPQRPCSPVRRAASPVQRRVGPVFAQTPIYSHEPRCGSAAYGLEVPAQTLPSEGMLHDMHLDIPRSVQRYVANDGLRTGQLPVVCPATSSGARPISAPVKSAGTNPLLQLKLSSIQLKMISLMQGPEDLEHWLMEAGMDEREVKKQMSTKEGIKEAMRWLSGFSSNCDPDGGESRAPSMGDQATTWDQRTDVTPRLGSSPSSSSVGVDASGVLDDYQARQRALGNCAQEVQNAMALSATRALSRDHLQNLLGTLEATLGRR